MTTDNNRPATTHVVTPAMTLSERYQQYAQQGRGVFVRFNAAFVKYYPRRPPVTSDGLMGLNRFFAQGAPVFGAPVLVAHAGIDSAPVLATLPNE